jgi:octaprenyl-diphosphate synthase
VDRKTASLFSVCGKLGSVAAGGDTQDGEKLSEFAWNLGMAFQLIDDMLDFVSPESPHAKHAGGDLKDGKVTLPLVYALEQASESERNQVAGVLRDRSYDAIPFANVLALVDRYGGIQRTRARARQFTDRAWQIVAEFPDSLCRRALFTLTDLVTDLATERGL